MAEINKSLPTPPSIFRLAGTNQIEIESEIKTLHLEKHLSIISISPPKADIDEETTSQQSNWEAFDLLLHAPLSHSIKTALQDCLKAGQMLTECDHLAIYLPIPGTESKLIKLENLGDVDFMPNIIHADEIGHLNIPVVWTLGTHTPSTLHQSALSAHQSFQATCPLDPDSPGRGLLALGGKKSPPPHNLPPVLALICRSITASLRFNAAATESAKELKETNYQLEIVRNIRNQISEGIIFVDMDFTIIDINTSSSMILGYSENEMLQQPIEKIMVCDCGIADILKKTGEKALLVHDLGEITVKSREGKEIPILIRTIPLLSESGPNALAILFSDLSTLKQYETRSRQLETQANIGEMIAVFAHEIRNPINNIRMGVENFAAYAAGDEELDQEIDRILGDVDRLSDLMKSILTAYRTKEYKMEPVSLRGFVESILFRWKPRMTRYGVEPSVEAQDSEYLIYGDKQSLEQVFTNIIQNAIDAMRDKGGKLKMRISENSESVQVDIGDTGPGIPPEIQEKIFNLYYTTRQNGNGIGLAITKQIVDAHNGQISVTSVPGGTVFRVELPKGKISNDPN